MMMITSIDNYVQIVSNVPALLQNKDFLENLHPRYTDILARIANNSTSNNGNNIIVSSSPASSVSSSSNPQQQPPPPSSQSSTSVLDAAINTLIETGGGGSSLGGDTTPNKHSIGIVGLLCAKTRTQEFNTNFEGFLVQVSGFMEVADWAQLRGYAAGVVTEISSAITDQMIRRTQPILGINLIGSIARSLQGHEKMLTCVHSCVLQLCCASYNFKAGLAYIIDDFEEFTGDLKQSENTQHLLTYLYYSGLIHTALKSYEKAIFFFEACTRVPAITLSHVMLEAYKKYVLTSLIAYGEVPPPHKCAAQVVNRVLKPSAVAYTELAGCFVGGSGSGGAASDGLMNGCVARNSEVYRRDGNLGLVKQVRVAQLRVLVRKLTRTFLTLSLEDVGRRGVVGNGGGANNENSTVAAISNEAERIVLGMIEDGSVYAKINQRDGNVRFLDDNEQRGRGSNGGSGGGMRNGGSGAEKACVLEMIESKINACMELNRRINIMNERISTNPEFISKVVVSMETSSNNTTTASASTSNAAQSSVHSFDLDAMATDHHQQSSSGLISSSSSRVGGGRSGGVGNANSNNANNANN